MSDLYFRYEIILSGDIALYLEQIMINFCLFVLLPTVFAPRYIYETEIIENDMNKYLGNYYDRYAHFQ